MFAQRLKEAMELRGITQGQIEVKTQALGRKVTQGHLSRLLRGVNDPTVSIAVVLAEMLGHSKISLTLDTYSHVLPSMQQEAAQRMQALLG